MEKPDLSKIPLTPGVYIYKNASGRVLYVGKAKALRKRLASYFRKEGAIAPKTSAMLAKAVSLETISTSTENEALLLEASLIKKHRPPYNIVLRDDKEYLLFRIAEDVPYPKLEIIRQLRHLKPGSKKYGKAKVFGPYASGRDVRSTWKAIYRNYPLRRCSDRSFKNRTKPCLYFHMGQCLGPCVNPVDEQEYAQVVARVTLLLQGRSRELIRTLQAEMEAAAERLDFEQAATLRDALRAAENTVEKQAVVLDKEQDLDVMGFSESEKGLALGLLFVRGGTLLGSRNFFWPGLGFESADTLLGSVLLQFYTEATNIPPQIVLPWLPSPDTEFDATAQTGGVEPLQEVLSELRGGPVRLTLPRSEGVTRLAGLASANARDYALRSTESNMAQSLAAAFMCEEPIERIEAVDVSHTSGALTKAAMVVFEGGQARHSDWRSYSFEDGHGDDYLVLAEWAKKRIQAGPPWPDLLLIDGGKGQLAAVVRVFEQAGLGQAFAIAGIAKARDEEGRSDRRAGNVSDRIFVPGRSNPLNLKSGSAELLFLQNIRNHVHDFVIGRHRKARSSHALQGELSRIPGFGPSLVQELWKNFDSLHAMASASDTELGAVSGMGKKRILALREHLGRIISP